MQNIQKTEIWDEFSRMATSQGHDPAALARGLMRSYVRAVEQAAPGDTISIVAGPKAFWKKARGGILHV